MSKYCENCGAEIKEEQDICLNCGIVLKKVAKTTMEDSADKKATTGFILGLISIVAWFIPLFGYPVTVCGIVFSAKGLSSKVNGSKAKTGLILSIIFLVVTLINSILGVILSTMI